MRALRAILAVLALATPATGHEAAHPAIPGAASAAAGPLPFAIGGDFTLTDQTGSPRGAADPTGRHQLVFFGYASCKAICSVALPLIGAVVDDAAAEGIALSPVMITVDPARDTPAAMAASLPSHHRDFVGLTGSEAALAQVYGLFNINHKVVFEDPELGPVYAHGSFIYLLDPGGKVLTLLPPILSTDRMTAIVRGYVAGLQSADGTLTP